MTNQQRNQIRTMRLQGAGYIKIGKILGISDNTVRSFCRRNGLDGKAKNTIACKQCGKMIKVVPKQKPKKFCTRPVGADRIRPGPRIFGSTRLNAYAIVGVD